MFNMLIRYWSKANNTIQTKAIAFIHSNLSLNQKTMAFNIREGLENANLDHKNCIFHHHDTLALNWRSFFNLNQIGLLPCSIGIGCLSHVIANAGDGMILLNSLLLLIVRAR